MSRQRSDSQGMLPPMEVRTSEGQAPTFRKPESTLDQAYALSADLFDAALTAANIPTSYVAAKLHVTDSLVHKWRSKDARACPSHVQMLQLPLSFHLALHRAMSCRHGFGVAALRRLLDAAGDLALAMDV